MTTYEELMLIISLTGLIFVILNYKDKGIRKQKR